MEYKHLITGLLLIAAIAGMAVAATPPTSITTSFSPGVLTTTPKTIGGKTGALSYGEFVGYTVTGPAGATVNLDYIRLDGGYPGSTEADISYSPGPYIGDFDGTTCTTASNYRHRTITLDASGNGFFCIYSPEIPYERYAMLELTSPQGNVDGNPKADKLISFRHPDWMDVTAGVTCTRTDGDWATTPGSISCSGSASFSATDTCLTTDTLLAYVPALGQGLSKNGVAGQLRHSLDYGGKSCVNGVFSGAPVPTTTPACSRAPPILRIDPSSATGTGEAKTFSAYALNQDSAGCPASQYDYAQFTVTDAGGLAITTISCPECSASVAPGEDKLVGKVSATMPAPDGNIHVFTVAATETTQSRQAHASGAYTVNTGVCTSPVGPAFAGTGTSTQVPAAALAVGQPLNGFLFSKTTGIMTTGFTVTVMSGNQLSQQTPVRIDYAWPSVNGCALPMRYTNDMEISPLYRDGGAWLGPGTNAGLCAAILCGNDPTKDVSASNPQLSTGQVMQITIASEGRSGAKSLKFSSPLLDTQPDYFDRALAAKASRQTYAKTPTAYDAPYVVEYAYTRTILWLGKKNVPVKLTMWAKSSQPASSARQRNRAYAYISTGSGITRTFTNEVLNGNDWQQVTVDFMPADDYVPLEIGFGASIYEGNVLIDDLEIEVSPGVAPICRERYSGQDQLVGYNPLVTCKEGEYFFARPADCQADDFNCDGNTNIDDYLPLERLGYSNYGGQQINTYDLTKHRREQTLLTPGNISAAPLAPCTYTNELYQKGVGQDDIAAACVTCDTLNAATQDRCRLIAPDKADLRSIYVQKASVQASYCGTLSNYLSGYVARTRRTMLDTATPLTARTDMAKCTSNDPRIVVESVIAPCNNGVDVPPVTGVRTNNNQTEVYLQPGFGAAGCTSIPPARPLSVMSSAEAYKDLSDYWSVAAGTSDIIDTRDLSAITASPLPPRAEVAFRQR